MAYRHVSKNNVKLDVTGGYVEMDIRGMSDVRGQVELETGTFDPTTRIAFEFSVRHSGEADGSGWLEPDTATRLDTVEASGLIDCRGYARVRLKVAVVSGTAGSLVTLSLCAYAPHSG